MNCLGSCLSASVCDMAVSGVANTRSSPLVSLNRRRMRGPPYHEAESREFAFRPITPTRVPQFLSTHPSPNPSNMASVAADMSVDMLSAPYDAQDPSAPDPGQPKRAYVPGTLAQPGESIFGGAAHVERPRDELDALFADDEDIAPPARPVGRIEEDLAREDHEPVVSIEDHDASIAEQRRAARALEEASNAQNTGLGIDEEVKQRKPRVPRAKLDHERLCSEKGIPRLRRITKDRLKFKGKGHEVSDVLMLLFALVTNF